MKKPLYIKLREGKIHGTVQHDGYYEDVDKNYNTIGIEILDYKSIEVNGRNILGRTKPSRV